MVKGKMLTKHPINKGPNEDSSPVWDRHYLEKRVVARPRFELGTRGFSVRCSTN